MTSPRTMAQGLVIVSALALAIWLVWERGERPPELLVPACREALHRLGYGTVGEPELTYEEDRALAWALERARPGAEGPSLARGEGGALRVRAAFPAGGEVWVSTGGVVWLARRPVPSSPGPDLFPTTIPGFLLRAVDILLPDPERWRLVDIQSWRESDRNWHRGVFEGGNGELPSGWRRQVEVEVVGSTVVSFRRQIFPLGTDLGVVTGRMQELAALRRPALLGLALVVIGMLVAFGEALATKQKVAWWRALAIGAAMLALSFASGEMKPSQVFQAAGVALAVALLPVWTSVPKSRLKLAGIAGVCLAGLVVVSRILVLGFGGWIPITLAASPNASPLHMLAEAWHQAVLEETLLRGALPGLAAPLLGWWGAGVISVSIGALAHPLPAVPLLASVAVEVGVQVALYAFAKRNGAWGAVVARGVCETLLHRRAYALGWRWDIAALCIVGFFLLAMVWKRQSPQG